MELTDSMIEEIRRGARKVEYGKVVIELEGRGNESSVDVVVTTRRQYENITPQDPTPASMPGRKY